MNQFKCNQFEFTEKEKDGRNFDERKLILDKR